MLAFVPNHLPLKQTLSKKLSAGGMYTYVIPVSK